MPEVSQRIAMLRMLMICGVVLLHVPPYVPVDQVGSGAFDFLKALAQNAVFRCTVPVLTLISGYLLFSAGLDRRPAALWRKKLLTLGVPFLFFNTLLAVAVFGVQSAMPLPISYQLVPFDARTMLDAAFGLTRSPINYPLNFLRDLFVLALLAPAFGLLLRRAAWPGLALVALVFRLDLDGWLLLRWDMAVMFYAGGMAAVRRWDLRRPDRWAVPCAVVFAALCVAVVALEAGNTTYLRLVAPFLVWPAASLLVGTRVGGWLRRMSGASYFIFLAHGPVLLVTWFAYRKLQAWVPYEVYWIVAPVATIAALICVRRIGMAAMPRVFGLLTGASPRREPDGIAGAKGAQAAAVAAGS